MVSGIREQYERFPYPPVSPFALPRRGQGRSLRYELLTRLSYGTELAHDGIRILVLGAGTFEPLVVAQAHPHAAEVVAVDLSSRSLALLQRRAWLARVGRPFSRKTPLRMVHEDFRSWQPSEPFDYIVASNVLHHLEDPGAGLAQAAGFLADNGIMRVVTYPKASRVWMREAARWFRWHGLTQETPGLFRRAQEVIRRLPGDHPARAIFESHSEVRNPEGLVDAFFNVCENPLRPLEWKGASERAGLELTAELQDEASRSTFLEKIDTRAAKLDRWTKLEVLDRLLECCANPVLVFKKVAAVQASSPRETAGSPSPALASHVRWELRCNLEKAAELLAEQGIGLPDFLARLKKEVGPRVSPRTHALLPWLAITDYPLDELLSAPEPSDASLDRELEFLRLRDGYRTNFIAVPQ